jgi:hypothetical protein
MEHPSLTIITILLRFKMWGSTEISTLWSCGMKQRKFAWKYQYLGANAVSVFSLEDKGCWFLPTNMSSVTSKKSNLNFFGFTSRRLNDGDVSVVEFIIFQVPHLVNCSHYQLSTYLPWTGASLWLYGWLFDTCKFHFISQDILELAKDNGLMYFIVCTSLWVCFVTTCQVSIPDSFVNNEEPISVILVLLQILSLNMFSW